MQSSPGPPSIRGTPSRRGKSPRTSGLHSPTVPRSSNTLSSDLSPKEPTTFTSCLSIPVEGAIPIGAPDEAALQQHEVAQQQPTNVLRRAPRKSKTDALAALQSHAQSSSTENDNFPSQNHASHIPPNRAPISVSPSLDLSSVKTSAPRVVQARSTPRLFGLEDCPTFYPTAEEFQDPMSYIRIISETAKDYGMCKVVPPTGWKMPFVTDTDAFRFKTRLQRLNSIEASCRAKVNFLEQLYLFHKQQGNARVSVPTINHKPLDLWLLRKEVDKLGGYDAVTKGKKWSDLGRLLGYGGIPGLSTQIKNSYIRIILPYEHFHERVRNSPSLSPAMARDPHLKTHTNIQSGARFGQLVSGCPNGDNLSPPSSPLTATSSPLSEPPDDGDYREPGGSKTDNTRTRRSTRMSSQEQSTPLAKRADANGLLPYSLPSSPVLRDSDRNKDAKLTAEQSCEICQKKNRGEEMLLCDGCDCGFHMFCLDPPLTSIPKGQWFCHTCLFGTGGDFGFDEGEEHSLSSFQARDLEFRKIWFNSHKPTSSANLDPADPTVSRLGSVLVSEDDVEAEFWRLVQSPNETVEIEYGADVHSTTHGSAMPTMETHPLDPASKDPWNLNNMPILPDSLLRYIKSDISGMTVPWTYVGMMFSTFCWHNEDHYTYSINYMHWGETKTWYGIPGHDAEKFEAAIKQEAPDLFEAQPDLLFQLVTLMNPKRLTEAGVRVSACNQRAGEFVITYPKAYHAGFNHGFNFNEAVNFALPDWLSYGRDCVQRYREHMKMPVFSHDELLITMTQQSQSIKTAIWLLDNLKEMTTREEACRAKARALGIMEISEEEDRPEDQYQCTICKTFCYLSQVVCQCKSQIVCVDHVDLLCEHSPSQMTLRKRFSDTDLHDILAKVEERANIPAVWKAKLNKLLSESARPQLRSLRALVAEGERISHHLPELANLRKCVHRASEWVDAANTFLIRKQSRKRSRRSRGRPPLSEANNAVVDDRDPGDRPDRSLDDLYVLLEEVKDLGFDSPEIGALQTLAGQAKEAKVLARALLNTNPEAIRNRSNYIEDCERVLLEGSSLNVYLDEFLELEKVVAREQLLRELEEKQEDTSVTLEDIKCLLNRARASNIPLDNKYIKALESRQRAGDQWEQDARRLLDQPLKTIEELDTFFNMDPTIPIDVTVFDRLMSARSKAKEFERQAKAWRVPDPQGIKPKVTEVMKFITRAEKDYTIPAVHDLKRTAEFAVDLETRCEAVLKRRYQHREDSDMFEMMQKWREYAKEHLSMFSLPQFEKLETELDRHQRWCEDLPWYCQQHQEPHGEAILYDVIEATRPEDDGPPHDEYFTCICAAPVRPPPPGVVSDAVQCDHCFARFHATCVRTSVLDAGGSCPFCDHHHWNGTIHKTRSWHFCFLPPMLMHAPEITKHYSEAWKQLEIIVHRIDRLSSVIGHFLSFVSQPGNQRPEYIAQVRHYMRKLFTIQFAVSPSREISFGLDLAGLHRILAGQPAPVRAKKRRRPKFTFGQDLDNDWLDGTRCICRGRTPYLLNYPPVECEFCNKVYHAGCVFFPLDSSSKVNNRFMCPLCSLRKNRTYPYSEVRVRHIDNPDPETYVNIKEMLDTFSKDIIYFKMLPPYTQTLFVELIRFVPGQPDNSNGISPSLPRMNALPSPRQLPMPSSSSHHRQIQPQSSPLASPSPVVFEAVRSAPPSNQSGPPPPPWSRWHHSTPVGALPPHHRSHPSDHHHPPEQHPIDHLHSMAPQSGKKRKFAEQILVSDGGLDSRSPKHRRMSPTPIPPSTMLSARPMQTLSPSLAMIVSPVDTPSSPQSVPSTSYGGSTSSLGKYRNDDLRNAKLPPLKNA